MDEKLLSKLLHEQKEKDSLEFKAKLKLYQSDGTLVRQQRDEFLKDILGLANGNSHIIRKTKYLIIGADNDKFDENGMRVLYNVDYKTPEQNELIKWLSGASSPAIVGLESELVSFEGVNLWVITIPPTFELHETIRELNASGHFQKHVVFMRQDEHTLLASVRDGISIRERKYLHRQELANPPAIWIGIISGGIVGFIVGGAKIREAQLPPVFTERIVQWLFTILGIFFGVSLGWLAKQLNEIRYDFRYMTLKARIYSSIVIVVALIVMYFLYK